MDVVAHTLLKDILQFSTQGFDMATVSPALDTHGHTDDHSHAHHEQSFIAKYVFSLDHKIIGIQFLMTTLIMLMVGGTRPCRALAVGVPLGKHAYRRAIVWLVSERRRSDQPRVLHDAVHDACVGDDFPCDHSHSSWGVW